MCDIAHIDVFSFCLPQGTNRQKRVSRTRCGSINCATSRKRDGVGFLQVTVGYRRAVDSGRSGDATSRRLRRCALLLACLYGGGQVSAQTISSRSEQMQAAIKEVAGALENNPKLKK